jgi:hypothetical protein
VTVRSERSDDLEVRRAEPRRDEWPRIGVVPVTEYERRSQLFAALGEACQVRFEGAAAGAWSGLAGLVAVGEAGQGLIAEARSSLPALVAEADEAERATAAPLAFADDAALGRALRGAALRDAWALPLAEVRHAPGTRVLATLDGRPVWTVRDDGGAEHHRVGAAANELGAGEALRDRLTTNRCLALLAFVQFVRSLVGDASSARPLRAAFLLDDPNLHWPTYGHLRYAEILEQAERHNYHLSVAMVPLDSWLVHPAALKLFRDGAARLSLTVHGNDHDGPELRTLRGDEDAARVAAQALVRAARFERRTGVAFDRVMVPPHEAASEAAAIALRNAGFEAMCMTRPYPWLADGLPWLTAPPDAGPLVGWRYADVVAGGLPALLRWAFEGSPDELVLRAFLRQPLVVYGHHDVLADGPDVFARTAELINGLGEVRWGSLASIARGGYEARAAGDTLYVRILTRRVAVELPTGIATVAVDSGVVDPRAETQLWVGSGAQAARRLPADEPVRTPRTGVLELELRPAARPSIAGSRRTSSRRIARRLVSEARDRARAIL